MTTENTCGDTFMNIYSTPYWLLPSEHFFGELRAVEVRYSPFQPRNAKGMWCKEGVGGSINSSESIDKSAESDIIKISNEFQNSIKGMKAANGVTVNNISLHAKERMIQRNVSTLDVKDALQKPYVTYRSKTDDSCSVFDKGRTHVVLSDNGNIITVAVNK